MEIIKTNKYSTHGKVNRSHDCIRVVVDMTINEFKKFESEIINSKVVPTAYKIVSKYTGREPEYMCVPKTKIGTQAKKRVYTCKKDFLMYGHNLIYRWKDQGWDTEIYVMKDEKWVETNMINILN